jgi:crossover junction endodeoxyribonuclease RuvC
LVKNIGEIQMTRIIGIDPGLSGAVVVLLDARNISIFDMPTMTVERNGKAKRQVSATELAEIIFNFKNDDTHVYVEKVSAMAGQGVTSVFSFGRSFGMIEGILAAFKLPVTYVAPATWVKAVGRGQGKDASRARAMELFPNNQADFKLKKWDGRADAALIAYWGKHHAR